MTDHESLKILFVSSEVAPYAKTGGLADVAGSLPRALAQMGHDVRIAMPRYKVIKSSMETLTDFPVLIRGRKETAIVRRTFMNVGEATLGRQLPVYFIDNYHYFDRQHLYMYADEADRFGFFCRAVLAMLPAIGFQPDIIHCNDWQTGPVCVLLTELAAQNPFYKGIATLMTIHNLHYQGNFPRDALDVLGLPEYYYHHERLEFYGSISFIKAGLVYADLLNAVSKTYAQEIQTPEYGEGMEGILRKRAQDLYGIINGIDYNEYDPEKDPFITARYRSGNLEAKKENKTAVQNILRLPKVDFPVIGLVSRLVDQKGLELIAEVFDRLMTQNIQLIVLGSGDRKYEDFFQAMAGKYPEKVGVFIGFNEALAKQIYAGSDMFLMPSRFEPCGLGQLIALRYGTVPIVRATGGLADTVTDYDPHTGAGNGFVFQAYNAEEMYAAILRALDLYNSDRGSWKSLVRKALDSDFSWNKSAREYVDLYRLCIKKHRIGYLGGI